MRIGLKMLSCVSHCVHVLWGLGWSHNDLLWSLLWCHGQRLCRAVCRLHGCKNDCKSTCLPFNSSLPFQSMLKAGKGPEKGPVLSSHPPLVLQYTASGKSLPKVELADDMCAVCGQRILLPTADSPEPTERTYRLSCNHLYPCLPSLLLLLLCLHVCFN